MILTKKEDPSTYESIYKVTGRWDNVLIALSLIHLYGWLIEGASGESAVIAGLYLAATLTAKAAKSVFYSPQFAVTSYAFTVFLLSFQAVGIMWAMGLTTAFAVYASSRNMETNFVTGTMLGYWLMLIVVSGFDAAPTVYQSFQVGVEAGLVQLWQILLKAGNIEVFKTTMSSYGAIGALLVGFLFSKRVNRKADATEKTPPKRTDTKKKQKKEAKVADQPFKDLKKENENALDELVAEEVKKRIQERKEAAKKLEEKVEKNPTDSKKEQTETEKRFFQKQSGAKTKDSLTWRFIRFIAK